jgi:hypothetical protein
MAFRAFKKLAQTTFEAAKAQDNNRQFNDQFKNNPLLDGVRLQNITIGTGASGTQIAHKLERKPLGYIIIRQNADARIWWLSWNDRFLVLRSSASVNVDIWVF